MNELKFLLIGDTECPHCKSKKGIIVVDSSKGTCLNCNETIHCAPIGNGLMDYIHYKLSELGYVHKDKLWENLTK